MTDTAPPPLASLKPYRLLLIRNAADVTYEEVGSVTGIAGALGLTTTVVDRAHGQSIAETASGCYDTVYLAGHGHVHGCGLSDPLEPWSDVAASICTHDICIVEDALVFCACCYGGTRNVAQDFFLACNIRTIVGSEQPIYPPSLMTGFAVLMHQVHINNANIPRACEMASQATCQAFRWWDVNVHRRSLSDVGQ